MRIKKGQDEADGQKDQDAFALPSSSHDPDSGRKRGTAGVNGTQPAVRFPTPQSQVIVFRPLSASASARLSDTPGDIPGRNVSTNLSTDRAISLSNSNDSREQSIARREATSTDTRSVSSRGGGQERDENESFRRTRTDERVTHGSGAPMNRDFVRPRVSDTYRPRSPDSPIQRRLSDTYRPEPSFEGRGRGGPRTPPRSKENRRIPSSSDRLSPPSRTPPRHPVGNESYPYHFARHMRQSRSRSPQRYGRTFNQRVDAQAMERYDDGVRREHRPFSPLPIRYERHAESRPRYGIDGPSLTRRREPQLSFERERERVSGTRSNTSPPSRQMFTPRGQNSRRRSTSPGSRSPIERDRSLHGRDQYRITTQNIQGRPDSFDSRESNHHTPLIESVRHAELSLPRNSQIDHNREEELSTRYPRNAPNAKQVPPVLSNGNVHARASVSEQTHTVIRSPGQTLLLSPAKFQPDMFSALPHLQTDISSLEQSELSRHFHESPPGWYRYVDEIDNTDEEDEREDGPDSPKHQDTMDNPQAPPGPEANPSAYMSQVPFVEVDKSKFYGSSSSQHKSYQKHSRENSDQLISATNNHVKNAVPLRKIGGQFEEPPVETHSMHESSSRRLEQKDLSTAEKRVPKLPIKTGPPPLSARIFGATDDRHKSDSMQGKQRYRPHTSREEEISFQYRPSIDAADDSQPVLLDRIQLDGKNDKQISPMRKTPYNQHSVRSQVRGRGATSNNDQYEHRKNSQKPDLESRLS